MTVSFLFCEILVVFEYIYLLYLMSVDFAEIGESVLVLKGPLGRINRALWGPLNKTIISAGEDAVIRIWDTEV